MNDMTMAKFGVGASAQRVEDKAFITGHGHYLDDVMPDGALVAFFVRSPIANGRFTITDLEAARAMPGVHLILTHEDVAHFGDLPCKAAPPQMDGSPTNIPPRPVLAKSDVKHVGDPVAVVIAETMAQASDAAEAIMIDWDGADAVSESVDAMAEGAPLVWPQFGTNLAFRYAKGEEAPTNEAFGKAAHVAKVEIINNRVVANFMEPRGAIGEFDSETGRYTLTAGTQGGHFIRDVLAGDVMKIDEDRIRVVTHDVGGGFGTKIFVYAEYPMVLLAAEKLGRPVKWVSGRAEGFMSDTQGRDNVTVAELALDENGKFLALRVDLKANMGAYLSQYAPIIPYNGATMATGVYDIATMFMVIDGIFTHTVPIDAYRGAGRPEAAYCMERLVDEAARITGIDRVELRRRNFIKPEQMPYHTAAGRTYDTGEFNGHLTRALEVADWDGFAAREAESRRKGYLRGIGVNTYIEVCAFPGAEKADLSLGEDGKLTLLIGTQSNGQGHATAYAQVVADRLGVDIGDITMIQGDTDIVKTGGGTGGSRSIPLGLPSIDAASTELSDKLKSLASDKLEAAATDLELSGGTVRVAGTDRAISFADLAAAADETLSGSGRVKHAEPTFPNGTHICELEVDPETGTVGIAQYVIVDDFGVTVNPLLLEGQVHGGIVQGIGQALMEHTVYDDSGQLVTGSFMDYALPRADDVPFFHFETRNVPSKHNTMGIKGAGEAGSMGSCGAVINAIIDTLSRNYGIHHIDMPATPAVIWRAIADATRQAAE